MISPDYFDAHNTLFVVDISTIYNQLSAGLCKGDDCDPLPHLACIRRPGAWCLQLLPASLSTPKDRRTLDPPSRGHGWTSGGGLSTFWLAELSPWRPVAEETCEAMYQNVPACVWGGWVYLNKWPGGRSCVLLCVCFVFRSQDCEYRTGSPSYTHLTLVTWSCASCLVGISPVF